MQNKTIQNREDVHQSSCQLHFALPEFDRLQKLLDRFDVSMTPEAMDAIILREMLHRLRFEDHKLIEQALAKAILEDLEIYNGDDLPRNIEDEVNRNCRILFGGKRESLKSVSQQCHDYEQEPDSTDPYLWSALQDDLEANKPEGTHFRVTIGFYKDEDESPQMEITSKSLFHAVEEINDPNNYEEITIIGKRD